MMAASNTTAPAASIRRFPSPEADDDDGAAGAATGGGRRPLDGGGDTPGTGDGLVPGRKSDGIEVWTSGVDGPSVATRCNTSSTSTSNDGVFTCPESSGASASVNAIVNCAAVWNRFSGARCSACTNH